MYMYVEQLHCLVASLQNVQGPTYCELKKVMFSSFYHIHVHILFLIINIKIFSFVYFILLTFSFGHPRGF